jgi:hypothetical protein
MVFLEKSNLKEFKYAWLIWYDNYFVLAIIRIVENWIFAVYLYNCNVGI